MKSKTYKTAQGKPELPKLKGKFYECGICDCIHPWDFDGDCRDDANRYLPYSGSPPDVGTQEIGPDAELLSWEDRQEADNAPQAQHSPLPMDEGPSVYADLVAVGREIANDSKCDLVYSERRIRLYAALEKLSAFNPHEHAAIRKAIRDHGAAYVIASVNHAQALAEALAEVIATGHDHNETGGVLITHEAWQACKDALANWETAQ